MMVVLFREAAEIACRICASECESVGGKRQWEVGGPEVGESVPRAEVASSRSRISGSRIYARAIATRCFWPPES